MFVLDLLRRALAPYVAPVNAELQTISAAAESERDRLAATLAKQRCQELGITGDECAVTMSWEDLFDAPERPFPVADFITGHSHD